METTLNSRFFRVQLMLVLIIVTVFSVEAYDFMENGIAYNINEDGASVEVTYQSPTQSGYSNLTGDLEIPSSVHHNGTEYTVTSIGDLAFFRCGGLTSVVIPNHVTKISFRAFFECTGLISVEIPNSVKEIDNSAFYGCLNLSSLHIPGSVESIGALAFMNCCGLSSITVEESNAFYDSRDNCNAIIETSTNTLVKGSNNSVIPSSIESIDMFAFVNCTVLESIVIPNSVTKIEKSAFHACLGLTSLTIGNSVTSIGETAFSYCKGLISVIIPNSVVSIGDRAFSSCDRLSSMTIGSSVSSIGSLAFGCGGALSSITCKISAPQNVAYGDPYHIFDNGVNKETCILRVPMGTLELYRTTMPWSEFTNIVVEGDVNNDEAVTSADVTTLYDFMLGNTNEAPASYDVDGDGVVTTADVTAIYNVILGLQ